MAGVPDEHESQNGEAVGRTCQQAPSLCDQSAISSNDECSLANMPVLDEQNGRCGGRNLESVMVKEAVWEECYSLKWTCSSS